MSLPIEPLTAMATRPPRPPTFCRLAHQVVEGPRLGPSRWCAFAIALPCISSPGCSPTRNLSDIHTPKAGDAFTRTRLVPTSGVLEGLSAETPKVEFSEFRFSGFSFVGFWGSGFQGFRFLIFLRETKQEVRLVTQNKRKTTEGRPTTPRQGMGSLHLLGVPCLPTAPSWTLQKKPRTQCSTSSSTIFPTPERLDGA